MMGRGLRRGTFAIVLILLVVALVAVGVFQNHEQQESPTLANVVGAGTGSNVVSQGAMTDEEALEKLREEAEKSRITISVAAQMRLAPDGTLRVNFIVPEGNNGLSERLEVQQGGRVVYASGVVRPGESIEYAQSEGAVEGAATATVRAVDAQGNDYGTPISSEVEIVASE